MTGIGINIPLVPCSNLSYDSYNEVLITLVILSFHPSIHFLKIRTVISGPALLFFFLGSKRSPHARLCLVKSPSLRSAHNCGGSWIRLRGLTLA